jgi:hypothetical protein
MSNEERQMLDLRIDAAVAVRRQREAMKISLQEQARGVRRESPRSKKQRWM